MCMCLTRRDAGAGRDSRWWASPLRRPPRRRTGRRAALRLRQAGDPQPRSRRGTSTCAPTARGSRRGAARVAQGQAIYDAQCASCHGTFGESNDYMPIAGGIGTLSTDQPMRTTGSKLNHATTLWDYINRAMPFGNPKTLSADEVYAVTAYVLHLNDLLPADASARSRVDREAEDAEPRRLHDRSWARAVGGKPDTRNVACMRDCVNEVRLSSQLPEHARDDARQPGRADAAARAGRGTPRRNGRGGSTIKAPTRASRRACEDRRLHGVPRHDAAHRRSGVPRDRRPLCRRRRRPSTGWPSGSSRAARGSGGRSRCRRSRRSRRRTRRRWSAGSSTARSEGYNDAPSLSKGGAATLV